MSKKSAEKQFNVITHSTATNGLFHDGRREMHTAEDCSKSTFAYQNSQICKFTEL